MITMIRETASPLALLDQVRESARQEVQQIARRLSKDDFDGLDFSLQFPPQPLDEDAYLEEIQVSDEDDIQLLFEGGVTLTLDDLAVDDLVGLHEELIQLLDDQDPDEEEDEDDTEDEEVETEEESRSERMK